MATPLPLHIISQPSKSLLAVASVSRVVFYDIDKDSQSVFCLPALNQSKVPSADSEPSGSETEGDSGVQQSFIRALHCVSDGSNNLVAVADSLKRVFVFSYPSKDIVFSTTLPKSITKVLITPDRERVLVGDKFGDLYSFALSSQPSHAPDVAADSVKSKDLLLGHISILTDIALDSSQHIIYTAQRDQKIKCSYYSAPEVIKAYFLGHSEYVSSISLDETSSCLLSVGGDAYILVSDFSGPAVKYTKIFFTSFISDTLVLESFSSAQDCFNCLKILKLADSIYTLLFEKCSHVPIFTIDFETKTASLLKVLKCDSWVVDVASYIDTSRHCSYLSIIASGLPRIYVYELLHAEPVVLECPRVFSVDEKMLNGDEIKTASATLSALFDIHVFRRGYKWSDKTRRQQEKRQKQ